MANIISIVGAFLTSWMIFILISFLTGLHAIPSVLNVFVIFNSKEVVLYLFYPIP